MAIDVEKLRKLLRQQIKVKIAPYTELHARITDEDIEMLISQICKLEAHRGV